MEKVLLVYASRMGSTAEITREIADQLIRRGHVVDVCFSGPCGPEPGGQHAQAPQSISQLCSEIGAHESKVFGGNLGPAHAVTWLDRRLTAGASAGDYRNWDDIRAWADSAADDLAAARIPVASQASRTPCVRRKSCSATCEKHDNANEY